MTWLRRLLHKLGLHWWEVEGTSPRMGGWYHHYLKCRLCNARTSGRSRFDQRWRHNP